MGTWWNSVANEVKRQPRAAMSPPMTEVSRVDFRRQTAMTSGDTSCDTDSDTTPNKPESGPV
jgi:hypothetical protein